MRRFVLLAGLLGALVLPGAATGVSFGCGLPESQPLWVEFSDGSVDFRQALFGKSGVVVATNGVERAAEMRALGAHTVYWHMFLKGPAGLPMTPRDHETMVQRTQALVQKARASTGCETPVIGLNELHGVSRPTPWPAEVVQYRENVLYVLSTLAENGLKPMLLVPGQARGRKSPYVGDTAADWWREVARHAYIVRQMHFNAPYSSRRGPILGARLRRKAMRDAVRPLLDIGIPADRIGLLLGFQSGPGKGGREGLEPTEEWLRIVKQEVLAAEQVTAELGLSSIWSWGWGTFNEAGADADKPVAACVYLWTRNPALCDAPAVAGPEFDTSLTEGQIILPANAQCSVGPDFIPITTLEQTTALTGGDRVAALTALLNRVLYEQAGGTAPGPDVQAAEQAIVAAAFAGDQAAYDAELAARGVDRGALLQAIGDELRRQQTDALLPVRDPDRTPATWIARAQKQAMRTTICLNDEVPLRRAFNWSSYFPFLQLPAGSVTLSTDRQVVRPGKAATLTGTAVSVRPRQVVTVYANVSGKRWEPVGEANVGKDGSWSLTVLPEAERTTYRAVSKSAASDTVTVQVKEKKKKKKKPKDG